MRSLFFALSLALALGGGALAAGKPVAALEVTALMQGAEQHRGLVVVEGVVSRVFPKEQKFGLIDKEEFKRCGVVTCAGAVLPVRWTGPMPESKNTVRVEGEVKKAGGGLEFVARSVEKAQPGGAGK